MFIRSWGAGEERIVLPQNEILNAEISSLLGHHTWFSVDESRKPKPTSLVWVPTLSSLNPETGALTLNT